jgi:Ca-activated chloride channel homolog
MFRIEHPDFFWLLIVSAVCVASLIFRKYVWQKDLAKWGNTATVRRLREKFSDHATLTWLAIAGIVLLSIAVVNPQWGFKTRTIDKKTADLYILLDISNSMLAEDIAPSRLERAKRFALDLTNTFKTERIGLVVFAGNAYMQSPLTTDWHAIELYLNAANPDQAGTQGTAIGKAIKLAVNSVEDGESTGHGALIIITDGEDHDSDAPAAISQATSKGWAAYVIGVGTEQGATIPVVIDNQRDLKRDETGQPVVTAMNRSLMLSLAEQGNGKYFDITEGSSIMEDLRSEFVKLERAQMEKRSFSEHKSYYQWFLLAAVAALVLIPVIRYKYDVI